MSAPAPLLVYLAVCQACLEANPDALGDDALQVVEHIESVWRTIERQTEISARITHDLAHDPAFRDVVIGDAIHGDGKLLNFVSQIRDGYQRNDFGVGPEVVEVARTTAVAMIEISGISDDDLRSCLREIGGDQVWPAWRTLVGRHSASPRSVSKGRRRGAGEPIVDGATPPEDVDNGLDAWAERRSS